MNILTFDVETTTSNKGNAFDLTNKLVVIGWKWLGDTNSFWLDKDFIHFQNVIDKADLIIGFNIKFDLHWIRRYGINFRDKAIWDCQIGEFILANQTTPYPSLNDTSIRYGLGEKIDVIKNEYWDKGIDTDAIPLPILLDYLKQDVALTEQVYLKQRSLFEKDIRYKIFKLQCMDLLVLEEIEWNGIKFNTKKALEKAEEIEHEISEIYTSIVNRFNGIPLNLSSNDHISCILYGGTISIDDRIPVGFYKTGEKTGMPRYKIITKDYQVPRLVEPLKGTEVKKPEGAGEYWQVNETVLRKLKLNKEAKEIVKLLNRHSELNKLRGTYLVGYSKLIEKMNWEEDTLHGNLNQTTVITGRLSSTQPNLQNADPTTKVYMETRYI